MAFLTLVIFLLPLQLAIDATATTDGTDVTDDTCQFESYFSFSVGNISCPPTAPVLTYLQTSAPDNVQHQDYFATTNWTMQCDCPSWAMDWSNEVEESSWRPFNDYFNMNGTGHFDCGLEHYLSGLAYELRENELNNIEDVYYWWGRCTRYPTGFWTHSHRCWTSDTRLYQGVNGVVSVPHQRNIIRRLDILYPDYRAAANNIKRVWSYMFCLVSPVECTAPSIENGISELSVREWEYSPGVPAKVVFNNTISVYCNEGYYMTGPNTTRCQPNGEWTELPVCNACKSIRNCVALQCMDGNVSYCEECRHYTSAGLKVILNRNRRKCRVVPYINITLVVTTIVYTLGSSVLLHCPAQGIPAPSIQWCHGNRSVLEVIDSMRLQSFHNGSLEISGLTDEDQGLYTCKAVNSVGNDTVRILVISHRSHQHELANEAPTIINQTPVPLFFERNKPALLHCQTSGTPPVTIEWSKRDSYAQFDLPHEGDIRISQFDNGSLAFNPIVNNDWGVYACKAYNDFGVDATTWIVCVGNTCGGQPIPGDLTPPPPGLVPYPPFIINWTNVFFITVGEILPLSCVAGGNPEPSYTWRQGKRVVSEGQSLVFENATINDTSVYECIVRNFVGQDRRLVAVIVNEAAISYPISSAAMVTVTHQNFKSSSNAFTSTHSVNLLLSISLILYLLYYTFVS